MAASSSDIALVGGVKYTVTQNMVRRAKGRGIVERIVLALALLAGVPVFAAVAPIIYVIMLNKSISQRVIAQILPSIMVLLDKSFSSVKRELLKDLQGRVLDVGCGDGQWLKYFSKASHITELEPNPHLIPKIEANAAIFQRDNPNVDVEIVNKFVHQLDPANPYDYIVFGNVMCEVPDQLSFLQDVDRVLKPGGKIVFQEHILDSDGTWRAWFQEMFNPWWVVASDGCHCNRRTLEAIKSMKNWRVAAWELYQDGPPHIAKMALGIVEKLESSPANIGETSVAKM